MKNINIYLISALFIIIIYLYNQNIQLASENTSQNSKNTKEHNPITKLEVTNNESPKIIYSDSYETESPLYIVNRSFNRLINPLLPPERSHPQTSPYTVDISPLGTNRGIPINISSRGPVMDYSQIGILTNNSGESNTILPLYGKPLYSGSNKWLYYTTTDKSNMIKIPITYKNRNCSDDFGCDELYDNSELVIPAYNNKLFKVTIYQLDKPRYIPYV